MTIRERPGECMLRMQATVALECVPLQRKSAPLLVRPILFERGTKTNHRLLLQIHLASISLLMQPLQVNVKEIYSFAVLFQTPPFDHGG
jgi:hypothetical protein